MPIATDHFVLIADSLNASQARLQAAAAALAKPGVTGPLFRLDAVDLNRGDGDFSVLHDAISIMQPGQKFRIVLGTGQVTPDLDLEMVTVDTSIRRTAPQPRLYGCPWGPKVQAFKAQAQARAWTRLANMELLPRLHSFGECPISTDPKDAELQVQLKNPAPYSSDLTPAWDAGGFTPEVFAASCQTIVGAAAGFAEGRFVCCPIVSPSADAALYDPVSDAILAGVAAAGAEFVFQNLCLVPGLPEPWAVRTAVAKGKRVALQLGTGLRPDQVAKAAETGAPWSPLWWESHPDSAEAMGAWILSQSATPSGYA